jgi:hypothetical protein
MPEVEILDCVAAGLHRDLGRGARSTPAPFLKDLCLGGLGGLGGKNSSSALTDQHDG